MINRLQEIKSIVPGREKLEMDWEQRKTYSKIANRIKTLSPSKNRLFKPIRLYTN